MNRNPCAGWLDKSVHLLDSFLSRFLLHAWWGGTGKLLDAVSFLSLCFIVFFINDGRTSVARRAVWLSRSSDRAKWKTPNREEGLLRKQEFNCVLTASLGPVRMAAVKYNGGFDLRDSCSWCWLRRSLDLTLPRQALGRWRIARRALTKVVPEGKPEIRSSSKNFAVIMEAA